MSALFGAEGGHDQGWPALEEERGGFKMPTEPEGWFLDSGPPLWHAETRTFSFFLHKQGCERVSCSLAIDALEQAIQSRDLCVPALTKIFEAHRQMIELRAAQKLNAGLFDADGTVAVGAGDI
jgi:Protein of unknown function (DUF1488)